ncbi:hypothetical protein PEC311524_10680 [Pectobacterium carotovorum subsp. carotovorum]|nr:hypothetical protein PEC311524_10680 [Pectobacterium carotovorum subsp. carotovorum]
MKFDFKDGVFIGVVGVILFIVVVFVYMNGDGFLTGYSNIIQFFVALGTMSSVIVALRLSYKNNKKDTYERNFSMLLEQHNSHMYHLLKDTRVFYNNLGTVLGWGNDRCTWSLNDANQELHKLDYYYGSYFRVLYRLLRHIDENYYLCSLDKKKFYSGVVRSFLNPELTFLLAVNISHAKEDGQYYKYKILVEKFSFLEHLILDGEKFISSLPSDSGMNWEPFDRPCDNGVSPLKMIDEICLVFERIAFGKNEHISIYEKVLEKNS